MHPSIAPLAEIFNLDTKLVTKALGDMSDEDAIRRPVGDSNSMQFVLGHMANSRYILGNLVGLLDRFEWSNSFVRGAKPKDPSEYPSIAELKDSFNSITEKLAGRLSELSDEDLGKDAPGYPFEDKTVLGAIAFLALHDSHHVGQLAYIRKALGYDSLVG